jgi:polyribonucleotide nucleotidyltransferase
VRVGRIRGNWILNPTFQQLEYSDLDIVLAGTKDAILMVEGARSRSPRPTCSRRSRWATRASRS